MEISTPKVISHCQRSLVRELSSQGCVNRICLIALSALNFIKSSGAVGDIPGMFGILCLKTQQGQNRVTPMEEQGLAMKSQLMPQQSA